MAPARRIVTIFTLGAVLLSAGLCRDARAGDDYSYEPSRKAVSTVIADVEWRDEVRGRDVPVRIHVPADASEYPLCPVVVFSPDKEGREGSLGDVVRYLSAHGYICAVVGHPDMPEDPNECRMLRSGDLSFALDNLLARDQGNTLLRGRIDRINVGVAGCGCGAGAVLDMAGQVVAVGGGKWLSLRDMRVRAAVAVAPPPADTAAAAGWSWDRVRIPVLTVGGEPPRSSEGQSEGWGCIPFMNLPNGHKYHLSLRGAECGEELPSRPGRWWRTIGGERHELTLQTMIAFLDDHLRDIPRAESWLESDSPENATDSNGRFLRK